MNRVEVLDNIMDYDGQDFHGQSHGVTQANTGEVISNLQGVRGS